MGRVRKPHVDEPVRGTTHGRHRPVRGIVHTTQGDPKRPSDIYAFWRRQGRGYGAHLVISRIGRVAQGAAGQFIVWATGGRNTDSLQIELCGYASYSRARWLRSSALGGQRAQLDKLAKWMAWWNLYFGVPIRFSVEHGWSGHRNQPHQDHTDPGPNFPWDWVLERAHLYRTKGW